MVVVDRSAIGGLRYRHGIQPCGSADARARGSASRSRAARLAALRQRPGRIARRSPTCRTAMPVRHIDDIRARDAGPAVGWHHCHYEAIRSRGSCASRWCERGSILRSLTVEWTAITVRHWRRRTRRLSQWDTRVVVHTAVSTISRCNPRAGSGGSARTSVCARHSTR